LAAAGDAIAALLRGDEETEHTIAASRLVAETFSLLRQFSTDGKVK
jgi:hypothetical protein